MATDVVDGGVGAVGHDAQLLLAGADLTCVDDLVLRLQQAGQLLGIDAHSCQFVDGDEDVDHLRLRAEEGNLHYARGCDDLRLDTFGPVAHLFVRETFVADEAVVDAEYVAEVIRNRGHGGARRQLRLNVEYFPPQFVPLLRDDVGRERGLQFEGDLRQAVLRLRFYLVHTAHRLYFAGDGFRDEPFHFCRLRTRIARHDDGGLDDERCIFLLSQPAEGQYTAQEQHCEEEVDNLCIIQ